MTGTTGTTSLTVLIILVICLTVICLACLISMILLVWWMTDSAGQHSYSTDKHQAKVLETLDLMVARSTETVRIQATLTETLLLGRANLENEPLLVPENPPEISQTPGEVWSQLPREIQENLVREVEESGTWRSPSEMLHDPSVGVEEPDLVQ